MSKKFPYWDETPYNNFLNFLGNSFEGIFNIKEIQDDDDNDESYCLLEDKLENFEEYKKDAIPYVLNDQEM